MAARFEDPTVYMRHNNGENALHHRPHKQKTIAVHHETARQALGSIGNNFLPHETINGGKVRNRSCSYLVEQPDDNASAENIQTMKTCRPATVRDIDAEDADNLFACSEYASDIYVYLQQRELTYQAPANYIKYHHQINERMRAILIDWLVQVHDKFRLLQETLFLAVSILDRYLAVDCRVPKVNLQLVGVTAMLLASKIEEIYTPEINDFVYITDGAYSPVMIRDMERKISATLNFNFSDPLCIHFLRRNSKAAKVDAEKHTLAKYFMELMLPDFESITFVPSKRAAASLCLAMKITDNSLWDQTMEYYSRYDETTLTPVMRRIAQLLMKAANKESKLLSVSMKYNRSKYFKVASSHCISSPVIVALAK